MKNQTQIWHCDICNKTIDIITNSKHKNSKSYKHKTDYGTVVKEYEFVRPEIDLVIYMLIDTIKFCRKICFQSFEFRCVYNIKYINMENNEEVILTTTIGYLKFKSHFY